MRFFFDRYPTLVVHISNKCNQKCRFCFKQADFWGEDSITLKDLDALIKKGIAEYRIKGIWFGGGEPLLYDSLNKAVELVRQNKLRVLMTTNGVLLPGSPEFRKIIDKVDVLLVSLHSHIPDVHNRLVGNDDSFSQVMKTLNYLQENNRKFIINCVCTAENYTRLYEFSEKLFNNFGLGLDGLQILALKYHGRVLENKNLSVEMSKIRPYLQKINTLAQQEKLNIILRDFPLCLAPREIAASRYPRNYIGYIKNGDYFIDNAANKGKIYSNKCQRCRLMTKCPGVDANYIRIYGTAELNPFVAGSC
ncbi:MAG: radical SAM protein [Planctomycetes bacterium]|nr:radical SAM protein [Planctomycetota bacterium]